MSLFECPESNTFSTTMNLQLKVRDFMALENVDVIV